MPGRHDVRRDEGVLAFEQPGGGSDLVGAPKIASVLAKGRIPVVVLNACQSGAVGKTGLIPPGYSSGLRSGDHPYSENGEELIVGESVVECAEPHI